MAHPASIRKCTERVNFGKAVEGIPQGTYANRVLHEMTRRRKALEDVIQYPDTSSNTVMNTLHEYLVMPMRNVLSEARRPLKLKFKWSSFTKTEEELSSTQDPDVDQISFVVAVALWLMTHAQLVFPLYPKSEELNDDKMKDALNSLKMAAGLCECVQQHPKSDYLDLTVPVNQALAAQCLAEAQRCGKEVEKWRLFLMFRGELYMAVARCFQGIDLLEEQEKSGISVTVLGVASKHISTCLYLAKEYSKIKPKARKALTDYSDFIWIQQLVALKVEKSQRENNMIYNQRIPEEPASLDDPKCLVSSLPFTMPAPNMEGDPVEATYSAHNQSPPTSSSKTLPSSTSPPHTSPGRPSSLV